MTRLLRATELVGHPVITLQGESEFEVKDVVFHAASGTVLGFTLRHPGFLGRPVRHQALPWEGVRGVGRDAVMIPSADVLDGGFDAGSGDDVLGDRVLTDDGTDLGEVIDVIVEVGSGRADVVGFEVEPSEAVDTQAKRVFIPLPDTISMSGHNVVVPPGAREYVASDLTGFGGSVQQFRDHLRGQG